MYNIVIIASKIWAEQNRTQFQRAFFLTKNYNTYFITIHGCPEIIKRQSKEIFYCPIKKSFLSYCIFPLWALLKIFYLKRKTKIDCVYTTYAPFCLIIGLIVKIIFGVKWIADIWDDPKLYIETTKAYYGLFNKLAQYYLKFLLFVVKKNFNRVDLVILSLAPGSLKDFLKNINNKKILYVTNGVDLKMIEEFKNKIQTRNNFKNFCFNICYIGHLKKIRGLDVVFEAVEIFKNKISYFKLLLVGYANKNDLDWLKFEIKKRKLDKYVKIIGPVEHEEALKIVYFSDVCLFPFPKKEELDYIYPIKVFEYMALGKVTIASNLKGVSQIIKNRYNGILVKPSDPQDLAEAIFEIYQNKKLKLKIEKNALISVKNYDWKNINLKIKLKIDEILDEKL